MRQKPTVQQISRNVSCSRMFRAPFVMTASWAAWCLCVELKWIYRAIKQDILPAEKEALPDGRFRWRILRSDLERIAGSLNHDDDAPPPAAEGEKTCRNL